ncbi:MAG: methylenetetrahydrofolate reductase [bacterium]
MNSKYFVEVLTPKSSVEDPESAIGVFAERYKAVIEAGWVVSIPDNPMGVVRFRAEEVIRELGLMVPEGQVLLHINTFHTKTSLDEIIEAAIDMNVRRLMLVSGDGGGGLPRVEPADLGVDAKVVTSVGLLEYIAREYPGKFELGVAFNPYEPADHELLKLKQKAAAGAAFVVTQPVVGLDMRVLPGARVGLPVYVGAWMSKRLELLSKCVGTQVPDWQLYDPMENLFFLHRRHRQWGLYLSMVGFKTQLSGIADILERDSAGCAECCGCG